MSDKEQFIRHRGALPAGFSKIWQLIPTIHRPFTQMPVMPISCMVKELSPMQVLTNEEFGKG
jgi:hypothetical protein